MFGRAKNLIYLYLQGGPPQHETFDPKPEAPEEVRGAFGITSTSVSGVQLCDGLPEVAKVMDRLALLGQEDREIVFCLKNFVVKKLAQTKS